MDGADEVFLVTKKGVQSRSEGLIEMWLYRQVFKKLSHKPYRIPQTSIDLNGTTSTPIGQLRK
nr:hypothetical protein [Streptococcus mutans]